MASGVAPTAAHPARVLVVDDSEMMRALIQRVLRDEPYVLRDAADGYSALHLFEDEPFDLVLTDLCMPDMDGLELIRELNARAASTPIVVLSGADGAHPGNLMRAAKAFGALAVHAKPIAPQDLRAVVRAALTA